MWRGVFQGDHNEYMFVNGAVGCVMMITVLFCLGGVDRVLESETDFSSYRSCSMQSTTTNMLAQ